MRAVTELGFFIGGALAGAAATWLFLRGARARAHAAGRREHEAAAAERLEARDAMIAELKNNLAEVRRDRDDLRRENAETREKLTRSETRREEEQRAADEKLKVLEDAKTKLQDSFKALSAEALSRNNEAFLNLARSTLEKYQERAKNDLDKRQESIQKTVQPVNEALKNFNERVEQIERERAEANSRLRQQITDLAEAQTRLSQETTNLAQALRAPHVRGRWGEVQLRRTVEMAGMVHYCDFVEQASVDTEEGRQRPDMIVRLPNDRQVVVDAKAPLAAYLEALEAEDAETRRERMADHARQLRDHMKKLAAKTYWEQFENTPEFAVLFLPGETFFSAALEHDPDLLNFGAGQNVILATPTTLIALLKAIAYGWRQEAIAREAKEIAELGRELYDRVGVLASHFAKLGKSLGQTVNHYNETVRSLETRLLVTARKFQNLESASDKPLESPASVDPTPRQPQAEELRAQDPEDETRNGP